MWYHQATISRTCYHISKVLWHHMASFWPTISVNKQKKSWIFFFGYSIADEPVTPGCTQNQGHGSKAATDGASPSFLHQEDNQHEQNTYLEMDDAVTTWRWSQHDRFAHLHRVIPSHRLWKKPWGLVYKLLIVLQLKNPHKLGSCFLYQRMTKINSSVAMSAKKVLVVEYALKLCMNLAAIWNNAFCL